MTLMTMMMLMTEFFSTEQSRAERDAAEMDYVTSICTGLCKAAFLRKNLQSNRDDDDDVDDEGNDDDEDNDDDDEEEEHEDEETSDMLFSSSTFDTLQRS